MPKAATAKSSVAVRRSRPTDLDELSNLENQVFSVNRMSRRSLRWLLASPSAEVLVAEAQADFAGAAVVLFRANSKIARLYSLAVVPRLAGRGIGSALIAAVEKAARSRKCRFVRLEVHERITAPSCATARPATSSSTAMMNITRTRGMRSASRSGSPRHDGRTMSGERP